MSFPHGFTALVMASDQSFDDAWSTIVPSALAQATEERVNQWISGRIAVQRALAKAGVKVDAKSFANGSHRYLTSNREWSFSLSHTNEWAYAWVTNESSKVSIGVDIEDSSREISEGVRKKFVFADDLAMDPIRLWSLKEAAFKSVPDTHQKDLVVAKIRIGEGTFTITDRDIRGHWRQEISGELVRSFAWVERGT